MIDDCLWVRIHFSMTTRPYTVYLCQTRLVNMTDAQPRESEESRLSRLRQLAWEEHCEGHWGPYKVRYAQRQKGHFVPFSIVKQMCSQCELCAIFRPLAVRREFGQPPVSLKPGHTLFVDIVGPFPEARGYEFIQCIVDSASRVVGACAIRSTDSSEAIRALELWIEKHGNFAVLVSDNATTYKSDQFRSWCKDHDVMHHFIAPYRHESIGVVQRCNRTVTDQLRKRIKLTGLTWVDELDWVVDNINNAVHSKAGKSPKELWDGDYRMRLDAHQKIAKARRAANRRLRVFSENLKVGDTVLVYDFSRLKKQRNKLLPRWDGPYELIEQLPGHLWKAKERRRGKPGRKKILVFHENFIQKFDDADHVW